MRRSFVVTCLLLTFGAAAQNYQPTWESLESRPVPQWFRDAKFGIFIHWGVYSVPGWSTKGNYAEWYQFGLQTNDSARMRFHKAKFGNRSYYDLANDFKAELFDPEEWAKLFELSGAKYIVLTSKHHDGFTLWPSKEANNTWGFPWNAQDIGPKRDLLGDLFKAVRKTSVHPGMYYSLFEWFNPLWKSDKEKYRDQHVWPQMKELITKYQPDVFWTDGDWDVSDDVWKSREFITWMYNESPVKDRVVTYDRWGSNVRFHHGSVYTPEYQPDLDFEDHYWEESRGMGFSYGYNRQEDAWDYNSSQSLILQLIDKASRGGNFLLDIGPDEHGKIPPIMQERLLQIGEWLKLNGEAIYNTERWKVHSQWSEGRTDYKPNSSSGDLLLKLTVDPDPGYAVKEVFYTYNRNTNTLYAIFPRYPSDRKLKLKGINFTDKKKISFLSTGETLSYSINGSDLVIELPAYDPNKIKTTAAYVLKIDGYGNFAPRPKLSVEYQQGGLDPTVLITVPDGTSVYYTVDGTTPSVHSLKYSKPFSLSSTVTVKAIAIYDNKPGASISAETTVLAKKYEWKKSVAVSKLKSGIQFRYFEPDGPINMSVLEPKEQVNGITSNISLNEKKRVDRFAFQFNGFLLMDKDAVYEFFLESDDGSKLYIDDELVIDNDGDHGSVEKKERVALKKGYHKIRVDYFDSGGGNNLKLSIASQGGKTVEIPSTMLWHN
jgi:alpha-L-fucosidase